MIYPEARSLEGLRILVVEDEYAVAADMTWWLQDSGAVVVGPAPTIKDALTLVAAQGVTLDRAVLDVNLRGEEVFPVAGALMKLAIPFIFATGYEDAMLPGAYGAVPRLTKPLDRATLLAAVASAAPKSIVARHSGQIRRPRGGPGARTPRP
jgi:CheY-like chemotaxis protein